MHTTAVVVPIDIISDKYFMWVTQKNAWMCYRFKSVFIIIIFSIFFIVFLFSLLYYSSCRTILLDYIMNFDFVSFRFSEWFLDSFVYIE